MKRRKPLLLRKQKISVPKRPPPQPGFGRPVEPYFDEPQGPRFGQPPPQGMPGFGPPPSFREPYASSSGMPGMGPPPGMRSYDKPPSVIPGLDEAWVLVYNVGRDNEGVYTHTQNGQPPSVLALFRSAPAAMSSAV